MQALEKQFPEPPLLPASTEHRDEVEEVCQHASGAVTNKNCSCLQSVSSSLLRTGIGACSIISIDPQLTCRLHAAAVASSILTTDGAHTSTVSQKRHGARICSFDMLEHVGYDMADPCICQLLF